MKDGYFGTFGYLGYLLGLFIEGEIILTKVRLKKIILPLEKYEWKIQKLIKKNNL